MNPLAIPFFRVLLCAGAATYIAPTILSKVTPSTKDTVNPATGRYALMAGATEEEIAVARQAIIGTSAAIATLLYIGIGMMLGKGTVAAAAGTGGAVA